MASVESLPVVADKVILDPVSTLDPLEQRKLQAMFGNGKQQAAKYVVGEKGVKTRMDESSLKSDATLVFKGCEDGEYIIDTYCTKILIDNCHNTKVIFNGKIITATVEVYKSNSVHLIVNTKVGTLQADLCKKLNVEYTQKEHFATIIWAGVYDLSLKFHDQNEHSLETGYDRMLATHPDLRESIDQFKVSFVKGELKNEKIVRLANGFPSTEREAKEYDSRQEEALQKLAKEAGITIGRKADKKIPPNTVCPKCNSGKKYKKCCGKDA